MKICLPGTFLVLFFLCAAASAQTPLNLKVNFQNSSTTAPSGYVRDFGESYGNRSGGYVYGWLKRSDKTPITLTKNGRKRNSPSDVRLATFMHMQGDDIPENPDVTHTEGIWEVSAANGSYQVSVSVGDADWADGKHSINIEGKSAIAAFAPTSSVKFKSATITVTVSDGRLTVDAIGGTNTKINYITIQPAGSSGSPTVNITTPASNASFTAPATIFMAANAADANGSITKVEFYNGSTFLHTETGAPYEYTWKNVPVGTYTLTAKATDNSGNTTTSSPVSVSVTNGGSKPYVVSVVPANGSTGISVNTSVSTNGLNLPNGRIDNSTLTSSNVYLTDGGVKVNSAVSGTTNGDAIILDPVSALKENTNYVFTITTGVKDISGASFVAYTSSFKTGTTPPVNSAPTVNINTPLPNANYTAPASIFMTADAEDANGTVTKVEFYNGGTLLHTETGKPYEYTWKNVPVGNYTLTAKAYDNSSNSTVSSPVPLTVSNNQRPSIISMIPANGSTDASVNTSVSTNILSLPNGGIDNNTLTSANVYLSKGGVKVPSNVNGTGGGDAIILVPSVSLNANSTYTFTVTSGVKDLSSASFMPYTSTFTTGAAPPPPSTTVKFTKVALPNASGQFSNLAIGPDKKLYALADDGVINRFVINADGTLGTPQLIYSLQDSSGYRRQTLSIGLAFDPAATATNLIVWVTHCNKYVFVDAPDWDGKLTKLSGPDLQTAKDILINLPRSAKDHVTNSIAFGPDNALYFSQGSTSGMGMADPIWADRSEHLLNAAVLRLDVSKITTFPLDVKTADGGGAYNPYATNAPLTIYASGVRNAYDLVWHSNGSLYAPTNGSAPGSNTPASVNGTRRPDGSTYNGPAIPSLINVQQIQNDYLFRVVKGGYYGHPNPTRGEYVMNGGNPTSAKDVAEVPAYPVGTMPDANWRGSAFDFKNNSSPDGAIEYKSNTFSGALKGKLLVVRYSAHDDIITLTLDPTSKNVSSYTDGISIPGLSGFVDPLALVEDVTKGNIYVSEYGGKKLTLLKPDLSQAQARSSAADSVTYPNPEFVSGEYQNVNSSCDDRSPTAIKTKLDNHYTSNLINPFGKIKVSPNPVTKKFTIETSNRFEGDFKIQITDAIGRKAELQKSGLASLNIPVDVTGLALKSGVYFLRLVSEKGNSEVAKLIVL